MKNLSLFVVAIILGTLSVSSQQTSTIQELLDRLGENHSGAITEVFSIQEIARLREHFDQVSTVDNNQSEIGGRRYATIENVSSTVSAIDPQDLSEILPIGPTNISEFIGAGVVRGNGQEVLLVDNSNTVHIRGINSSTATQLGSLTGIPAGESVTGLEFRSGSLYALSTNGAGSTTLSMINQGNWQATPLGQTGQVVGIALGRDANNNLYSYDIDTDLLSGLNPNNGAGTVIGNIGFDANFAQGMTFDPFAGKLYMTAFNNSVFDAELREVDVSTGATINLGRIVPGITMQFGYSSYYNASLGKPDLDLSTLLVYPNPASYELTISAEEVLENIEIVNVLGQSLLNLAVNKQLVKLNIDWLTQGVYIIKVRSKNNGLATRKIIKR
jgi:hypothetical protein